MLGMIQAGINRPDNDIDARLRALRQVDVLILDDWGVEKVTEWAYQCLFTVLNSRYNERVPTVVTTNMMPGEWAERDGRLASRLGDTQLSKVLVFATGDYRQRRG
jgi:DNA replication protein DnaC